MKPFKLRSQTKSLTSIFAKVRSALEIPKHDPKLAEIELNNLLAKANNYRELNKNEIHNIYERNRPYLQLELGDLTIPQAPFYR